MNIPGSWTPTVITVLIVIFAVIFAISIGVKILDIVGIIGLPVKIEPIYSVILLGSYALIVIFLLLGDITNHHLAEEYFTAHATYISGTVSDISDTTYNHEICRYATIETDNGEIILNLDDLSDRDEHIAPFLHEGDTVEGLIMEYPDSARKGLLRDDMKETAWGSLRVTNRTICSCDTNGNN